MDSKFFSFVWRHSKRDQIFILILTVLSFPLVYISLEIPKIIINEAIEGTEFPKEILWLELEQIPYLLVLCFGYLAMVVGINGIKWFMNVQIGMTGERMLRRMRYMLFERVMRFRIARFRSTKPGEVIQSILGEIEPLGGFFGEVIATPAFQGGLLCVYVAFIFVQDAVLGLAAISLYPIQAFIIPKLQAKIVRLNKERAGNTRKLADTIGEAVNVISDVHTNDTARWHLAQASGRLHQNTLIRLDLFKRKFTIKFVNNFMNHLTPFFFYSAGGYLVIRGDLDFGSLVAVLAAYKDLAAPWKAVLNYWQRWTDFNSRYVFVVENFSGADVLGQDRIYGDEAEEARLEGPLEFAAVEGGPGTGGLIVNELTVPPGALLAVRGGDGGAREAFLKLAAALQLPAAGRVAIGGHNLGDCTLPQIGQAVGYVGSDPGIISRTMRANLLYGLMRNAPDLADADEVPLATMLREARLTGNTTADPLGDWVSYAAAGVDGNDALNDRLLHLVEVFDLSHDLYSSALGSRLDAETGAEWTEAVLAARMHLRQAGQDLSDLIEDWAPDRFNTNATILENVLYALPIAPQPGIMDHADVTAVREVLEASGAVPELVAIGLDIAREFSDLYGALEADSSVLDSFTGYSRAEIIGAHELVLANPGKASTDFTGPDRALLMTLALGFIQVRDRLDILDEARIERLLAARDKARRLVAERDDFVSFDEDRFSPAETVAENILHAKRRFDRKSAWRRLETMMAEAIDAAGLRERLIRLGLAAQVSASGLSTSVRRRVALVRAIIKRPNLLVLDGVAGSDNDADADLRRKIRAELQETTTILYAAAEDGAEAGADLVVDISAGGSAALRH